MYVLDKWEKPSENKTVNYYIGILDTSVIKNIDFPIGKEEKAKD